MRTYQHFIDGGEVEPAGGEWLNSIDPYLGEPWARIARGTEADVDRAVTAATRAMRHGTWATMTATERGKLMLRLADLVAQNAERLAEIEVRDNGKLLAEMRGQLNYHPEWWRYFGGLADKIQGAVMPIDKPRRDGLHSPRTGRRSGGPDSVELAAAVRRLEVCGRDRCRVQHRREAVGVRIRVDTGVRGADDGSRISGRSVQCRDRARRGGGRRPGRSSRRREDHVHRVRRNRRENLRAGGQNLKRVSLELGGKSPNIVFDDCDLDAAAAGVVSGIFAATGQTCIAGSRLLVQNSIREDFTDRVVKLGASARKGNPMLPDTNIGPVTTPPQYAKILDYIDVAEGRRRAVRAGRQAATSADLPGGQFVEPTIFTDVKPEMRIAREEVFGPGAVDHRLQRRSRRSAHRERHDLWPGRWCLDQRHRPRGADVLGAEGRNRSGSTPTALSAT